MRVQRGPANNLTQLIIHFKHVCLIFKYHFFKYHFLFKKIYMVFLNT